MSAGAFWVHDGEEPPPNQPLPSDTAMFEQAVELAAATLDNLPPGATNRDRAFAVADIYYWRGALSRHWVRPDRRGRRAA